MVSEGDGEVAVVERGYHLVHQRLKHGVGDGLGRGVEGFKLGQELLVMLVPVETELLLIVPQAVVAVHGVPEHAVLAGEAVLSLCKQRVVVDRVVVLQVGLIAAAAESQRQQQSA